MLRNRSCNSINNCGMFITGDTKEAQNDYTMVARIMVCRANIYAVRVNVLKEEEYEE